MQTLLIPTLLEPTLEREDTETAWLEPPRGPAPPDLARIFADIADTAITRAAGIPCSLAEYRDGLAMIVRRLQSTIDSVPVFAPGFEGPRGSVLGRLP